MTSGQFLRIKKLNGKAIVEVAARHNHREILAEIGYEDGGHIDPERVALNRVLVGQGTAAKIAGDARALMDAAGVKPLKKTAVMALEIIVSLPSNSSIDKECFFNESVKWAAQYFAVPIISAIVHNDEAAPHCHLLLLPLVGGRMVGSDLMGGPAKLNAMQTDFHARVGKPYGLTRQAPRKRHNATIRQSAINSAFDVLESNSGLSADVLTALLVPHMGDPEPLMIALGLPMPSETVRLKDTFVGIMTRPCEPERSHIGIGQRNHIGIDGKSGRKKVLSLSCVGKRISKSSFLPPNQTPTSPSRETATAAAARLSVPSASARDETTNNDDDRQPSTAPHEVTAMNDGSLIVVLRAPDQDQPDDDADDNGDIRERDDQPAAYWDESKGEFARPPSESSRKAVAAAAVRDALRVIRPHQPDPPRQINLT